jgi:UDP-glucose 4-epimerase
MFKNKSFLITGGTGSFGRSMVEKLITMEVDKVVVFSRDETKQSQMRTEYQDPRVNFILGDVREEQSIQAALQDIDFVFHAAALKQVPASESHPWEFMKTNTAGSHNLLRALRGSRVTSAVFLSTDKAVYPLNAMGMTKALVEKLVRAEGNTNGTNSVITRYGNVIGSRGSVIPKFIDQIKQSNNVTVTNPEMTRFMMSLEESVDLVLFAMTNGQSGDLFVHKASAASVNTIVEALCKLLGRPNVKKTLIGSRPGEKIHETLLTAEEKHFSNETEKYFLEINKKEVSPDDIVRIMGGQNMYINK